MATGQLTMQQLHILHCTFRFYNCTNCDQLHVKICPVGRLCIFTDAVSLVASLHVCSYGAGRHLSL